MDGTEKLNHLCGGGLPSKDVSVALISLHTFSKEHSWPGRSANECAKLLLRFANQRCLRDWRRERLCHVRCHTPLLLPLLSAAAPRPLSFSTAVTQWREPMPRSRHPLSSPLLSLPGFRVGVVCTWIFAGSCAPKGCTGKQPRCKNGVNLTLRKPKSAKCDHPSSQPSK